MKRQQHIFQNTVTIVLVICAVTITVAAVYNALKHRMKIAGVTASPAATTIPEAEWASLVATRRPVMGGQHANVKIVEFSDYACSYCRALEPVLNAVVHAHAGRVAVYRYAFPLNKMHPHAEAAAVAAKCAHGQDVYEHFDSLLFTAQLNTINWRNAALAAGVANVAKFMHCLHDGAAARAVSADVAEGHAIDVRGTPTLIINRTVLPGLQTYEHLNQIVSAALN